MSKPQGFLKRYSRLFLLVIVLGAVIYLIAQKINVFGNVLVAMIGFGAVVLVHELGHFIFAKISDVKVEAFSIGFPPALIGFKRTEKGYRVRILPDFFSKEKEDKDKESHEAKNSLLTFTIGRNAKAGETEYCISMIPFGGFVKMLGQEDTKTAEAIDDPRSYTNKPVGSRMAVIAAGVTFNAISALIIFMIVFLKGINLQPAVVGGVIPDSPAAVAGVRAGDEIIELDGKRDNLDFGDILTAAALSNVNEAIKVKVRHEDDSIEEFTVLAEKRQTSLGDMRSFGISPAYSLTVAKVKVSDANALFEATGLRAGDRIKKADGKDVRTNWELAEVVRGSFEPEVKLLAERVDKSGKSELVESRIKLDLVSAGRGSDPESETGQVYSMVPRLKLELVSKNRPSFKERVTALFRGKKATVDTENELRSGDIILVAGEVENPTYKELRDVTTEYENKEMPIKVSRADSNGVEKTRTITVTPKRSKEDGRVVIGISLIPMFDTAHAVVAKTVAVEGGPEKLAIPRGAVITAVDGVRVTNFYDVINQIRKNAGQRINIDYRLDEKTAGDVTLDAVEGKDCITVQSIPAELVPFKEIRKLYKAKGPVDAVVMGYNKTVMFIVQTYVTLNRLLAGLVSPKLLMGPIGIISLSYQIVANKPLIDYAYLLGLISASIAVLNLLPILPFDGGHLVFLLIEKVKGSAVNEKIQGAMAYAGLAIIGALFLYVTFNDIVRSFLS